MALPEKIEARLANKHYSQSDAAAIKMVPARLGGFLHGWQPERSQAPSSGDAAQFRSQSLVAAAIRCPFVGG
jgi:hypothetical protein